MDPEFSQWQPGLATESLCGKGLLEGSTDILCWRYIYNDTCNTTQCVKQRLSSIDEPREKADPSPVVIIAVIAQFPQVLWLRRLEIYAKVRFKLKRMETGEKAAREWYGSQRNIGSSQPETSACFDFTEIRGRRRFFHRSTVPQRISKQCPCCRLQKHIL